MSETNPFLTFTDADLKASMFRAIRTTAALAVFGFGIMTFVQGWKSGIGFLAGALVSITGLYEWQQLIGIINAKLDKAKTPRSTGFVLGMFFLRLCLAAVVIYVTLKCFHGSLYALVAGLGLAVVALTIEALRLLRS
jgi:ATP synthase I chain